MNAREALRWMENDTGIMSCNDPAWPIAIRALRLLAAAESNDGEASECKAAINKLGFYDWMRAAFRFEVERNGLAARVGELEKDAARYRWLRVQRHADIAACWYLPVMPQDYPVDTPEQRDAAIDAARRAK